MGRKEGRGEGRIREGRVKEKRKEKRKEGEGRGDIKRPKQILGHNEEFVHFLSFISIFPFSLPPLPFSFSFFVAKRPP